jgi:hypothetical protein
MKMRDLIRYVELTTTAPAWPPLWIGSLARAAPTPMLGGAVLESIARVGVGRQLTINIRFEARRYIGLLTWDGPPPLHAVESLLRANIGRGIGAIGGLDI